jgi:NAD(P)-dependent dehydrogenase (short-subunit alcohol dehydrogenase family)
MATVREVFETNTFGVMAMTQAVLPQLRAEVGRCGERDRA